MSHDAAPNRHVLATRSRTEFASGIHCSRNPRIARLKLSVAALRQRAVRTSALTWPSGGWLVARGGGACLRYGPPDAGARSKLNADHEAQVASWARTGPELAADGVVRWRRSDLARKTERQFGVVLAERSVGERLTRLGFWRLSVRPQQLDTDALGGA